MAPACEENLKGVLAATKHQHAHTLRECVCAQSNFTYRNAGFQLSPTHILELQVRSSIKPQTKIFIIRTAECVFKITVGERWSRYAPAAVLIKKSHKK